MRVRVVDLQSLDESLTLPDGLTVSELLSLLHQSFQYDISHISLFHCGRELPPSHPLTAGDLSASPTLVLFNTRVFTQKSYPKVDQAFRFFPSRYQEFAFSTSFAEDAESPGRAPPDSPAPAVLRDTRRPLRIVDQERSFNSLFADSTFLRGLSGADRSDGYNYHVVTVAERRHRSGRPSVEELRAGYGVPDDMELSRADFQALSRLEASGVDRATVVSVYIACERNEVLAQNCLMSMS
jgi:hypothetical protein